MYSLFTPNNEMSGNGNFAGLNKAITTGIENVCLST